MASNTIVVQYRSYKGVSNLTILRKSDNVLYSWPKPSTFVLQDGQNQVIQTTRSDVGELGRINTYTTERMPELSITYAVLQPELFAFQTGNTMIDSTLDVGYPRSLVVPTTVAPAIATIPPATAGQAGFGIAVDAVTEGSVNLDGLSTTITQVAFGGFTDGGVREFAVGANGELVFSADLQGCVVSLLLPWNVNGRIISDILVGEVQINAALVNSNNKISFLTIPSAVVNTPGTPFEPGVENFEIRVFPLIPPGACRAYQIVETEFDVACSS